MKRQYIIIGFLIFAVLLTVFIARSAVQKERVRQVRNKTMVLRSFLRSSIEAPNIRLDSYSYNGVDFLTPDLAARLMPEPNMIKLCAEVYKLRPARAKDSVAFSNIRLVVGGPAHDRPISLIGFAIIVEIDGEVLVFDDSGAAYQLADNRKEMEGRLSDPRYDQRGVFEHILYFDSLR